ncbi:GNAT family N-acetyltransferase [Pragia fontium]|uniref:Acetyltransferase (GNAT) family protein n=2 Tax=Pragia fontium TaxID=82985 RepID=A0AAJ4WD09_9GAMM|nr:GNAT family N-acetyltransferase [Pragia fontium]AKJ43460.1 hypothetical protein QQ39_16520 [Pragia fontium]SFD29580.1 Acetyltransferase (GNAT) family protein [Pragia fontium DSM 5563 = ATCC 49100]SUB83943.1 Predicted acetyltransferase [Pragia fontium]VEJ56842.1 Predicted acetyltransferase [Pragia fontium]GKX64473.1 hypothetical protein SOASR032_30420 [Pragia fontium]
MYRKLIVSLAEYPQYFDDVMGWCYREFWQGPKTDDFELNEFLKGHLDKNKIPCSLVALCDGRPVGSVHLVEKGYDTNPFSPCLTGLYVLPGFRNLGFGTMLIENALERARASGFPSVYLAADENINYYTSRGWTVIAPSDSPDHYILAKRKRIPFFPIGANTLH